MYVVLALTALILVYCIVRGSALFNVFSTDEGVGYNVLVYTYAYTTIYICMYGINILKIYTSASTIV